MVRQFFVADLVDHAQRNKLQQLSCQLSGSCVCYVTGVEDLCSCLLVPQVRDAAVRRWACVNAQMLTIRGKAWLRFCILGEGVNARIQSNGAIGGSAQQELLECVHDERHAERRPMQQEMRAAGKEAELVRDGDSSDNGQRAKERDHLMRAEHDLQVVLQQIFMLVPSQQPVEERVVKGPVDVQCEATLDLEILSAAVGAL